MSLLRRSRLLLASSSRLRQATSSPWPSSHCSLHINNQKRAYQNRNRTSQRKHHKPEIVQEQELPRLDYAEYDNYGMPRVRVQILRPVIFTLILSSAFYAFFSYRQAKEELKSSAWNISNPINNWTAQRRTPPTPVQVLTNAWGSLDPVSKLTLGLVGANSAVHLSKFVLPGLWENLWHIPARNVNYTLLTSAFVHAGPLHFGFNMVGLYNFFPTISHSPLFQANTNHLASFYLSTAVIASLAQHVSTVFSLRPLSGAYIPSGGASGVLFAILGSFCIQYPTRQIGIMFLPFSFDAQYFLPVLMAFDIVGVVRGYSFANFGHAAHLGGALVGIAYTTLNGRDYIWRPSVEFWKRRLKNKA